MHILNLPLEMYKEIFMHLPPAYAFKLRSVCKDWNNIASSTYIVDTAMQLSGTGPMDAGREELANILKNHHLGKPVKQQRIYLLPKGGTVKDSVKLCNDRAAVMVSGTHGGFGASRGESHILLFDLVQGKFKRYLFKSEGEEHFISSSLCGLVSDTDIYWLDFHVKEVKSVARPQSNVAVKAYRRTLATLILGNGVVQSLWTYDTSTNTPSTQAIGLRYTADDDKIDFAYDENYLTMFFISSVVENSLVNVVRYSKDRLVCALTFNSTDIGLCVSQTGKNQYQVGLADGNDHSRSVHVDMDSWKIKEYRQREQADTLEWQDHRYVLMRRHIRTYTRGRQNGAVLVVSGQNFGVFSAGAVNYRWMVLLESTPKELGRHLQILDFGGEAEFDDKVEGPDDWAVYKTRSSEGNDRRGGGYV